MHNLRISGDLRTPSWETLAYSLEVIENWNCGFEFCFRRGCISVLFSATIFRQRRYNRRKCQVLQFPDMWQKVEHFNWYTAVSSSWQNVVNAVIVMVFLRFPASCLCEPNLLQRNNALFHTFCIVKNQGHCFCVVCVIVTSTKFRRPAM